MDRYTRLYLLIYIVCVAYAQAQPECATSTTVLIPRGLTTNSVVELALTDYFIYHHPACPEDRPLIYVQASYIHQESLKRTALGRSFLPQNKSSITVSESGLDDVCSLWLGVVANPGTFSSHLRLAPKSVTDGLQLLAYADLDPYYQGLWAQLSFVVSRVTHFLCPIETLNGPAGIIPGNTTAVQALSNPELTAGRFYTGSVRRHGVDDIQVKVGYNYFFDNRDHIGLYALATAPTGHRQTAHILFEPLVGSKHPSLGAGLQSDVTLWSSNDYSTQLSWLVDINARFVFKAHQRRLFDLINGDWSRYLLVATQEQPRVSQPGPNFFAQHVTVTPRGTVDFWTALHYAYCAYNLEVGYNLWWRDREELCINNRLLPVGIYDLGALCRRPLVSASQASINQSIMGDTLAPSDQLFTGLTTARINKYSGAQRRSLSHTVYGALSYTSSLGNMPSMVGIVVSYEHAPHGRALSPWTVLVKAALGY